MELKLVTAPVETIETEVLIAVASESEPEKPLAGLEVFDQATDRWVSDVHASGEFKGKAYETAMLHRPSGLKARRLILAGAGKQLTSAEFRRAVAAGVRSAKKASAQNIAVYVGNATPEMVEAAGEAVIL